MRKKTATALLAAGLVTGGGVALVVPNLAQASDSGSSSSTTDRATARLNAIKDALKGLVSNGTITQSQADKVASTLSQSELGRRGGPGGFGPGFGHAFGRGPGVVSAEATAKVIGITVDQLRTALRSGQTLAQIAQAHNVSKAKLIQGLVDAAKAQLAADVKAGRLTQAQADRISGTLTDRITQRVDEKGPGFGPRRPGDGRRFGPGGGPGPSAPGSSSGTNPSGTA